MQKPPAELLPWGGGKGAPPLGAPSLLFLQPDVMNVPKVAELLGVAPATVRREIARGSLECVHVGASVRVTKTQLLKYVGEVR